MKKNGFTLAELLGVVIILGVIALIIFPTVSNAIKNSKDKSYDQQIESILKSAKNWGLENRNSLSNTKNNYVSINELQQSGYLPSKQIINPETNEEMNGCVIISYDKEYYQYTYEYEETSCDEFKLIPIITLNGENKVIIGIGETYTDAGATATYNGKDISSSINVTNNVNTSTVGSYEVKYNITYNNKKAEEVIRTVIVMDKNPVITLSPNKTNKYEKSVTVNVDVTVVDGNTVSTMTYKINGGSEQNITNNKIVINTEGEHTIEVTATDNKGNTTTITSGIYKIDNTAPTITFAEGDAGLIISSPEAENYDLLTGVTVTDNTTISIDDIVTSGDLSAIADEYTITYTVSDEAGNTVTKERRITVVYCDTVILGKEMAYGEVVCLDPDKNPRYVGIDPNNYVQFNGELWRIIGKFDGQAKIIRDQPYNNKKIQWASNALNDWVTASLKALLNDGDTSYLKSIQTSDPTSYGYIDLNHVWNIGAYDATFEITGTRSASYNVERSNTPGDGGSDYTWIGAIGLMYPSDYGYASNGSSEICEGKEMYQWNIEDYKTECAENSWLYDSSEYQWTITPHSDYMTNAFFVYIDGSVAPDHVIDSAAARPALYLKSNVKIVDGTGTSDDPYKLDIETIEDGILSKSDPSDLATLDPDENLRYVGSNPDNYVRFNNELWRIIGVFDGQAKIIRNEFYNAEIPWNEAGQPTNNWVTASLKSLLNDAGTSYLKLIETNDNVSYNYIDLGHLWNLGGNSNYDTSTRSDFYIAERGNDVSYGNSVTWSGAIGLMYPSDYGYSTSGNTEICSSVAMYDWQIYGNQTAYKECVEKSWIYDSGAVQWTLTHRIGGLDGDIYAYAVMGEGFVDSYFNVSDSWFAVRPTLYLKSNVRIVDGTGTSTDPFILSQ